MDTVADGAWLLPQLRNAVAANMGTIAPVVAPSPSPPDRAERIASLAEQRTAAGAGREVAPIPAAGPAITGQVVAARRPPGSLAEVLTYTDKALAHFAVWPSEHQRRMAVLWAAAAHGRDADELPVWEYAPRLCFLSPEPGGGKSRCQRMMSLLVPNGKIAVEPSDAAVARLIGGQHKTLFLDEADILFGTGSRKSGIRSIINGGYEPDGTWDRASGSGTSTVEVPVFGFMGFAGLAVLRTGTGNHLKATLDRCLMVHMRKAPEGYRAPRLGSNARAMFGEIRNRLAGWLAYLVATGISQYIPEVPEGLGNRPAALWEPLLAVADAAGDEPADGKNGSQTWGEVARTACEEVESSGALPDANPEAWHNFKVLADSWEKGN